MVADGDLVRPYHGYYRLKRDIAEPAQIDAVAIIKCVDLTAPRPVLSLTDAHNDVRSIYDIEREVIRFAIAHYRGQMSEVARHLKIGRSTLYRKMEYFGIGVGGQPGESRQNPPASPDATTD
jgi:transcriptional regulator with GAF, ATPase, and Fis domain